MDIDEVRELRLYTVRETAAILGITTAACRELLRSGQLSHRRIWRRAHPRVTGASILKFMRDKED